MGTLNRVFRRRELSKEKEGGKAKRGRSRALAKFVGVGVILALLLFLLAQIVFAQPTVIDEISFGASRAGVIAANPDTNRIYAAQEDFSRIAVIDGATNTILTTVPTLGYHTGIDVDPVTNRVYVSQQFAGRVRIIDGATNCFTDLPVGGSPGDLAVNPVTNQLYVIRNYNDVAVFDTGTNAPPDTISLSPVGSLRAIAVNPSTNRIYVTDSIGNQVIVIDGVTNSVDTRVPVHMAHYLGVNPVTNRIYVIHYPDAITVIDGVNHAVVDTIFVSAPSQVGVNPDTNRIYVTSVANQNVSVIDGDTNTVVATVYVGSQPHHVAVIPSTSLIYVANDGHYVSVIEDLEVDTDGDGIPDDIDNCPFDPNPGQEDFDTDGQGDACDPDDDDDGVPDVEDAFPFDPTEWADNDGDGTGDNADPDDDNDGQTDDDEMFCGSDPLDAGSLSPDNDGDNSPDCVDPDDDNDGYDDASDAFPFDPAEWADDDADGVGDNADNCSVHNPNQTDSNNDGQGDACDPVVTSVAGPLDPININDQPVSISGEFTDADDDGNHTAVWDWGDNTTSAGAVDQTANTVSGSHPYAEAGVYIVKLIVSDSYPASDEAVYQFIVIYNTDGGFVTGGGWIESPEGAYKPAPSLTGKANFGFVSKYKKGATEPTGQTEFQFQVADLNFHSSSYDWLVVTGSDYARFKGSGTINGMGDYKFMLWAGDGEPDTFRIKIWEEDESGNETVTYDNGSDQAIGGGSVVIHTRK